MEGGETMNEQTRASLLELICTGFSKLSDFQKGYFLGVGDGMTLGSVPNRTAPDGGAAVQVRPGA